MRYVDYCIEQFGHRMQKLTLNTGMGCPNRDGTLGTQGCTFCNNDAFVPAYCQPSLSITQQIDEGIRFHSHRHRQPVGYLAYLQAYSNTYAPLPRLRQCYEEALAHPQVEGLIIATRPDCVDDHLLDYLASLAKRHYLMLEYGIESCYDRTLQSIQRHHDYACTVSAIRATAERGIPCGGHLILGLPGESREEIVAEASLLSHLPLTTLKLHQLQLLRGSELERQWRHNHASIPPPFAVEDYVTLVVDFLRRLRSDIAIERVAAAVPPRYLADPARSWHTPDGLHVTHEEIAQRVRQKLADLQ